MDGHLYFARQNNCPDQIPLAFEKALAEKATGFFKKSSMPPPTRVDLPFFAYGLFKPGQLGFDSLREHVSDVDLGSSVDGALFERDGVPLFSDQSGYPSTSVSGALITFTPGQESLAYQKIANIEPEKQYKWEKRQTTGGIEANVLVAKSHKNGAHHVERSNWDGREDPLLKEALDLVEAILVNADRKPKYTDNSVERTFELQMAYMLLWTSIERYTSLRYHLRKNVMAKIMSMADEKGFQDALQKYVTDEREVYSTDDDESKKLSRRKPRKALQYYYQVRSTAVHRGKTQPYDAGILVKCIEELLQVFRKTLDRAFEDCAYKP